MEQLAKLSPLAQVVVPICICVAVCVFIYQFWKTIRENIL
jgi:hypothetical protein